MLVACCNSTSQTPFPPLSLNSLDLAGVRLLSPRDSQILSPQLQVPTMLVLLTRPSSLDRILLELRTHSPRPITRGKSSGDFQTFTDLVTRRSTIPLGCSRP